uniref:C2H2-type domain-containing protein n=1 Tax=Lygus hesperus TaxID=30085 RepID=A0A0A9WYC4_LYGHE
MDSSVVERHSDLIDPISIDQRLNQNQKINLNTVVVTETQETTELIETQYINLHRLPENLQKVQLVTDSLSNDLLSQQVVELTSGNDFIAPVAGQFYEDEFLHHDLTEEDRRLAAALVAVQLVQQQKHSILAPELLKSTSLPPLAPIQNVTAEKQPVTSSMVTSYLQGFDEDDDSVPQQLIDTAQTPERMLKIYHTQSVNTAPLNGNTSTTASLSDIRLPALPPLKKVLSNPSIMRHRYDRSLAEQPHEEIDDKELTMKSPGKEEKVELHSDNSGDLLDNEGESDFDGDCTLKSSKRSLPHKKRIPRKLKSPTKNNTKYKCQKCGDAFISQAALMSHRSTHQVPAKRTSVFACEICGFQNNNQVRFFEHLKGHYEPSVLQVTDVLQQQESFIEYEADSNATPIIQETFSIKESPEQASASNFACNQCGRTFRRQKTFDAHLAAAHPPLEEFSEPEDMMEGIRHVVNIQTAEDEKAKV